MIILNGIQELKVLKHTECQKKKKKLTKKLLTHVIITKANLLRKTDSSQKQYRKHPFSSNTQCTSH